MAEVRLSLAAALAALAAASAGISLGDDARAQGDEYAEQPSQAKMGPGGRDYPHRGFSVRQGGMGSDAWFVFQPVKPRPEKAPLAIITHGYFEFSGYDQMYRLIRHTVRQGNVVIYPRWQTDVAVPCPGPFDIEPCMTSTVNGIRGALDFLRSHSRWVQPRLGRTSYFGFSFGGIITANLANRYEDVELPKPRAIFLEDPHDGGLTGPGEPALDDSLAGIPSSTLIQCHSSEDGVISEPGKEGSSCNAVFPMLTHVPSGSKDLVMTRTDTHGEADLTTEHGVCAGGPGSLKVNAYDWNFCWKVWDALRSCALSGRDCGYALGNTRNHRWNGRWSDGAPIKRLKIQNEAPIAP